MGRAKPIKVCLTNRGADTETPWAEDLGPGATPGSRLVRLINVPFLHAKPTWGDVIEVTPANDGLPTWDRAGLAFKKLQGKIAADGGRWAMIVDYAGADGFAVLVAGCTRLDIICEGAWEPQGGEPGRAYLAVPFEHTDATVMAALAVLPLVLTQIHPSPKKPRKPAKRAKKSR